MKYKKKLSILMMYDGYIEYRKVFTRDNYRHRCGHLTHAMCYNIKRRVRNDWKNRIYRDRDNWQGVDK